MRNYFVLIPALFFLTNKAFAQYFPLWDRLEGVWRDKENPNQFYEWKFIGETDMNFRQIEVVEGDTLEQLAGTIRCQGSIFRMTMNRAGQLVDYTSTIITEQQVEWGGGEPMRWEIDKMGRLWIDEKGKSYMYHKVNKGLFQFRSMLYGGINYTQKAPIRTSGSTAFQHYTPGRGYETGLWLGLSEKKGPFALGFDLAFSRRIFSEDVQNGTTVYYISKGQYTVDNWRIGLVPGINIGERRQLMIEGGAYLSLQRNVKFDGYYAEFPNSNDPKLNNWANEIFLMAGMRWAPKMPVKDSKVRPHLFMRYMASRTRSITAGVGVTLGK